MWWVVLDLDCSGHSLALNPHTLGAWDGGSARGEWYRPRLPVAAVLRSRKTSAPEAG